MTVHLILQGKGGVGKSLVAAFLAQYYLEKGLKPLCVDTDPVNDTFAQYQAFDAMQLPILGLDRNIDTRAFDILVEKIMTHDGHMIIDNGASTFVPLSAYLAENNVLDILEISGKKLLIHSILTSGQGFSDTISGLSHLLETHNANVVVWKNEFFGAVERDGQAFVDSRIYKTFQQRIKGIVTIERRNYDTFGKDIEILVREKMTFAEAMESEIFSLMPKQRIKIVQKAIFEQLEALTL